MTTAAAMSIASQTHQSTPGRLTLAFERMSEKFSSLVASIGIVFAPQAYRSVKTVDLPRGGDSTAKCRGRLNLYGGGRYG